jgi:membrane-associated phospholipid phosphatase
VPRSSLCGVSRRPLALLTFAALSAAAAAAVWLVALGVPRGRALDASALEAFAGVARPPLASSINGIAHLADPAPLLLGGLALVGIALWRRRPFLALAVPAILIGANATTQLLKPALGDVRLIELAHVHTIYPGSWPSGHATAAMSLALCAVLVAGPQLRALVALLGAGFAVAVGYALVVASWHLPSDVLGGYLVAATFALAAAAAVAALEARGPARRPATPELGPAIISAPAVAAMGATAVAFGTVAVAARAPGMTLSALEHPSGIVAGLGIAALGLALTAGLAVALRNS